MNIDLKDVAVYAPAAGRQGRSARLSFDARPRPDGAGYELDQLHDDTIGTLARAISGTIGPGALTRVAIKLQRDEPLVATISREVADAKFEAEYRINRKLADALDRLEANGDDRVLPIVRWLDLGAGAERMAVDRLPPCLFCVKAAHALPWKGSIEETAGQDPSACRGCGVDPNQRPDGCRPHLVTPVNTRRNAVLVFELMEQGSLQDYLVAQQAAHQRAPALDDAEGAAAVLGTVLALADDMLAGVELLHAQGTAHLDLNPENICLRRQGGRLVAKLIDLGLAESDDINRLPQGEQDGRIWPKLEEYAAPECTKLRNQERLYNTQVSAPAGDQGPGVLMLTLPETSDASDRFDPRVCVGDEVLLRGSSGLQAFYRVHKVEDASSRRIEIGGDPGTLAAALRAWLDNATAAAPAQVLYRHRGTAADIFSLGVILWALLTGQPKPVHFKELLVLIRERAEGIDGEVPPRALLHHFAASGLGETARLRALVQRRFGAMAPVAEQLLGIALRATLRGSGAGSYAAHRATTNDQALARMRTDLDGARAALGARLATRRYARMRHVRSEVMERAIGTIGAASTWTIPATWASVANTEGWQMIEEFLDFTTDCPDHLGRELNWLQGRFKPSGQLAAQLGDYLLRHRAADPHRIPVTLLRLLDAFELLRPIELDGLYTGQERPGDPARDALTELVVARQAVLDLVSQRFRERGWLRKVLSPETVRISVDDSSTARDRLRRALESLSEVPGDEESAATEIRRRLNALQRRAAKLFELNTGGRGGFEWVRALVREYTRFWNQDLPRQRSRWENDFNHAFGLISRHCEDLIGRLEADQTTARMTTADYEGLIRSWPEDGYDWLARHLPGPSVIVAQMLRDRFDGRYSLEADAGE